jgi:hypothetical protein
VARPCLLVFLLLALAAPASGQSGAFVRFPGGGPAATDCMLVTDVAGVRPRRVVRCTDGDPACDADGRADGTCHFGVRLCVDASGATAGCHADVVTSAEGQGSLGDIGTLATEVQALPMPISAPDTCTAPVVLAVPRHGRRPGRAVLRGSASMASGHSDRDRLVFVCARPAASSATFATLQRKIFTPSCAMLSCHGAGNAGGMTLAPGAAYANLVGVLATNPAARAAGLLRVAPGDPDGSFLLRKLTGTLTPDEGAPMPRVGAAMPPADIDLIRRWIAAGAPADAAF